MKPYIVGIWKADPCKHQKVIPDFEVLAIALVKVQRFAPCVEFIPLVMPDALPF